MQGRRVSSIDEVTEPGDYYLNPLGDGDTAPSLWFRLPVTEVPPVPDGATEMEAEHLGRFWTGLQRINGTWSITDEGATVHVQPSILASTNCASGHFEVSWHGFLEHGVWRTV